MLCSSGGCFDVGPDHFLGDTCVAGTDFLVFYKQVFLDIIVQCVGNLFYTIGMFQPDPRAISS